MSITQMLRTYIMDFMPTKSEANYRKVPTLERVPVMIGVVDDRKLQQVATTKPMITTAGAIAICQSVIGRSTGRHVKKEL